jgi:hypothetical protein
MSSKIFLNVMWVPHGTAGTSVCHWTVYIQLGDEKKNTVLD